MDYFIILLFHQVIIIVLYLLIVRYYCNNFDIFIFCLDNYLIGYIIIQIILDHEMKRLSKKKFKW